MTLPPTNPLVDSGKPLFFRVANVGNLGFAAPPIRLGDAVRLCVRSLSVMQKEALVVSARTGAAWRLASDEGAYLAGLDAAPCPLSFLTTGMVSSYMTEVLALAKQRRIRIDQIRLVQDNTRVRCHDEHAHDPECDGQEPEHRLIAAAGAIQD